VIADCSNYGDRPNLADLLPALNVAEQRFRNGDTDRVEIVFARFVSAGKQHVAMRQLLPIERPRDAKATIADFEYEPDESTVLSALFPRYLESVVYQSVLENVASEQAARMMAMHNASDNAANLIDDLTLTANKVRQSSITTELMEIVGGSAALASQN